MSNHATNTLHVDPLFTPVTLGDLTLTNRLVMAPLTRCRAPGHVPNELMAQYYAQRASAGLIITECTMISANTSAFASEPAIYNDEHIAGWKKTTDAVHAAGGKIVLQIWHAGRAAHPALNNGAESVSCSAIAINGDTHTPEGKKPFTTPQVLSTSEITVIVDQFRQAAANAITAGFDGVEIHGANGYLIDQFLRDGSNTRSDAYGGSLENRARFLCEIIEAVSAEIGAGKTGLRLSPLNSFNDMKDSDPIGLIHDLTIRLNDYALAYLHLMRGDFFGQQHGDVVSVARKNYQGHLILNMGYSADEGAAVIANNHADAIAYGTGFLANPDLPARIKAGAELNNPNEASFYTPGAEGYTDYPTMNSDA